MNPTPLENARKFKELCDGWNDSTAAGRVPTSAEFTRGVGWDVRLVSGVEAEEAAAAAASGTFGDFHGVRVDDSGYSFLRTDCRAGWRKSTRGEGKHRPKLDMVFGDDFADLVGAGATRVGWMNGALADPGDGGHKHGEVNVNKALGHSVWTPHQDHLPAARRVEAAKYSAASMVRRFAKNPKHVWKNVCSV